MTAFCRHIPQGARWCESRWGLLLEIDFIHPAQDADGDDESNDAERVAGTAPFIPLFSEDVSCSAADREAHLRPKATGG